MDNKNRILNLIEIFTSVQGETSLAGLPTTFIRLAACNLRCSWCDTSYSFGKGEPWEMAKIIDKVKESGLHHVCITGGEPLLQAAVHPLMEELCRLGYQLTIETGGSLSTASIDPRVGVILDIKCPGSGMSHKNYWANIGRLRPHDEVKFVILDLADYEYAKGICMSYQLFDKGNSILFSPVHGALAPDLLVQWIIKDKLRVRLNLQLHKFIWDPFKRGV